MKQHKTQGITPSIWGLVATTLLATLTLSTGAFADGNAANGKVLYDKSQCQKCHGTEVYTREDHKVKDLDSLGKQVRMCDSQLSVNWFDDEIDDVAAYLNETFYKFDVVDEEKKKDLPKP